MHQKKRIAVWRALYRLTNIGVRAGTLASRFVLIIFLAQFLSPAEVGLYGLLLAAVTYALTAIGFDFYTYATRELIAADPNRWAGILRDQFVFFGLSYAVLLPICLLVFHLGYLPWYLALWFFPLLALEHVAQECNRVLVAISEPLWASVVLFLRSGMWALVAVAWMWTNPESRNLEFVLGAWLVGGLLACLTAALRLGQIDRSSLAARIKWAWIGRGLRVALPFVVATLSVRALYTFDRYWIEAVQGLEVVAAYVLFIGIGNSVGAFLDAAVFSFILPDLVAAASNRNQVLFDMQMRRLRRESVGVLILLCLAALLLARPVVGWLDNPVYAEHFHLLYWTMLGAAMSGLSMIPHYGLWARRIDRPIIISHVISVLVFVAVVLALGPSMGAAAAPAGIACSFLFLLVVKAEAFRRAGSLAAAV